MVRYSYLVGLFHPRHTPVYPDACTPSRSWLGKMPRSSLRRSQTASGRGSQGAGEGDELFLAGGEAAAALADLVRVTERQTANEIRHVDLFGGGLDILAGDGFGAEPNVLLECPREEIGILEDHAELAAQL